MGKYKTLVNILDCLRFESPHEYKRYRPNPNDMEKINQARSRALIHLYLKVTHALLSFQEREELITDGSLDGGIDAYYIDQDSKKVFFVQSKFRTTEGNYEKKNITFDELLRMDVDRIVDGEDEDEDGNRYSGKIQGLIRKLSEIPDIGRYQYTVVILANVPEMKNSQIKKLTGGFAAEVFDYTKVYNDLVFPVVTGTYYRSSELCITLALDNKSSSSARITYNVKTEFKECDITVVFVPIEEIAKILYKYKNAILKYNPRCYLEMRANSVNKEIHKTVCDRSSNEFALFNNGITMLSDETSFNEKIGKKDKAQIIVENPQIINGGQTAYTLSRIFSDVLEGKRDISIFKGKEVLLKIITFGKTAKDEDKKLSLIEEISKATNRQSEVSDADRRSNDKVQIDLQKKLFEKYGAYYERKKGEFSDGVREKYLERYQVIDREVFLRIAMACDGSPSQARRSSARQIFREEHFNKHLKDADRVEEYYYAYTVHQELTTLEKQLAKDKNDPYGTTAFGHSLRYGKYAATYIITRLCFGVEQFRGNVKGAVETILDKWLNFEFDATEMPGNSQYFKKIKDLEKNIYINEYNWDNFYKGRTLNKCLFTYFIEDKKAFTIET